MAASNGSEFLELEIDPLRESFAAREREEEEELMREAIARLPSQRRDHMAVLRRTPSEAQRLDGQLTQTIDVRKLDRTARELVVKKALATTSQDNSKLLAAIKDRLDRVGIQVPNVEVRFDSLNVVADVQMGSRALPTLINATRDAMNSLEEVV